MKAIQLFVGKADSFEPTGVWFCDKCKVVHRSEREANQCCLNYQCNRCNQDTGSRMWLVCEECRKKEELQKEKARFDKAEKLTVWDDWVYCEGHGRDGYCESLDELKDECESEGWELPEYVWACEAKRFVQADLSDITQRISEDGPEDWDSEDLEGLEELKAALAVFNAANIEKVAYWPDYTKAVLLNTKVIDK